MRVHWFHLVAVLSAKVLEDGDAAIEAESIKQYDEQARARHGIGYVELKALVEDAAATARARLTTGATTPPSEEAVRVAINTAAEEVFREFVAPPSRELAPEVADEEADLSAGGGA